MNYCSESFHHDSDDEELDNGVLEIPPWNQYSGVEDRIGVVMGSRMFKVDIRLVRSDAMLDCMLPQSIL